MSINTSTFFFLLKEESSSDSVSNTTRECNPTSTGAILLADILPSLAIKILAPFFPFLVQ